MNGEPSALVSPGLWGFFAFFLLGLALYLLMRNMNARMRRMSYRSEELARQAEQERTSDRARNGNGAADATHEGRPGTADANGPASGEAPSAEPPQAPDGQAGEPNR